MRRRLLAAALLLLAAGPAMAWTPDPPLREQKVTLPGGAELTCTVYRDVVLRVPGADANAPDDKVMLVRYTGAPPPCTRRAPARATRINDDGGFLGRKGDYLFFQEVESTGAIAWSVDDLRTGRRLFSDTVNMYGPNHFFHAVVATPDALRITFRRGHNLECSILLKGEACWRAAVRDRSNAIPPEIAALPAPLAACQRSYRASHTGQEDPSMIAYEARITWTRGGGRRVEGKGPVACDPMP